MIDSAAAGRGGELRGLAVLIRYMYYSGGEERSRGSRAAHYNTTMGMLGAAMPDNFCDGRQRDRLKFHLSLFGNRDNGSICAANAPACFTPI